MQTTVLPVQYSIELELWRSKIHAKVLVCFTPPLTLPTRALTCHDCYAQFIFTRRDNGKPDEHTFMPMARWTDLYFDEWAKVTALLGDLEVSKIFDQACLDLVL